MINEKFETVIELEDSGLIQLTKGSATILRAYIDTKKEYGAENQQIILKEPMWDDNFADALKMLDVGGIDSIILADEDSGLMKSLTFMLNNGWEVESSEQLEVGQYGETQDVLLMSKI